MKKNLTNLEYLESQSIHIIREVASEFQNPIMMYSIGKDSSVMLHLAMKAFSPNKIPFKLLHVDTMWKFKEMISFRDWVVNEFQLDLIVHTNEEGLKNNIGPITHGSKMHTDIMKTQALKQALNKYKFDAALGGARRDEEKSRAKERIFSFRDSQHRWDPKNQRPELWNLYNTKIAPKENVRIFPLSNWTELDVWQYIYKESIPIVPLYLANKRPVIEREGMLILVDDDRLKVRDEEIIKEKLVRFRTLGCYPLTGAFESSASTVEKIILELLKSKNSERQGRLIDKDQIGSMEIKKQEGYF
jgi:sulfate adenylyltransferase subunit 2